MSYIRTYVAKHSHLHLIPFHFYNFLPCLRLPRGQGHSCLGAGQDDIRLLGSGDRLKLSGCHGLGPARSWETGKCLLTVQTFVAFGANAEVAIAAAAAAVAMVTRVAGARIHNKLKRDHKWGQLFPRKKSGAITGKLARCLRDAALVETLFQWNWTVESAFSTPCAVGGSLPRSSWHWPFHR